MADNRIKRSSNKSSSSPSKEHQKWNIPPQALPTSAAQPLDAIKSSKTSAIDSLFDSGYDSQTVSKTSIDLESEFDQKLVISSTNCPQLEFSSNRKTEKSNKWSDSGLSITTDSGLHIDDEFIEQQIDEKSTKSNSFRLNSVSLREAYEPDQDGDTYLHLAIIQGLEDVVYALIRIVPHPDFLDICNHLSQTPLHLAALTAQPQIVRRLIISGATVDLRDRHGNTALHIACAQSDYNCVRQLIAPIDDREIFDAQVVNYPVGSQHLPNDLLELRNYEGETCLHLAAYNNPNKKIIEFLVKSGADVNAQEGKSGKSILHWSVETQNLDLIQFLVNRCKANVNVRSYAGHTPVHNAWMLLALNCNNKLKSIVRYLCDCGAEPSLPPNIDSDSDSESDDD